MITIVIPAKDEHNSIQNTIATILEELNYPVEIIVVIDDEYDLTWNVQNSFISNRNIKFIMNDNEPGPAGAIKLGIKMAKGESVVVVTSDGSDKISDINLMEQIRIQGSQIVSASRYAKGGRTEGAPFMKSTLSWLASLTINGFIRVGTSDITNTFKLYDSVLIKNVEIKSKKGFTLGMEMISIALLNDIKVSEIPTEWIERSAGKSKFRLLRWIPSYIYWYLQIIKASVGRKWKY
jgi:dolichol-phosphate mannosyltransferase